jgi:hypothetical protein
MVYGSEAVSPADLVFGATRLTFESTAKAEASRLEDVDVLEEAFECCHRIGQVSADSEALPRQSSAALILCSRRPGTPPRIGRRRTTQTITTMGRTIHHHKSHPAWVLPAYLDGWNSSRKLVEY